MNTFTPMKRSLLILFLLYSLHLSGQPASAPLRIGIEQPKDTTHIYKIALLDGKNFENLYADSLSYNIKDVKIYQHSILHFKVNDKSKPNEVYEFYRIDELKYASVKYNDGKLVESGVVIRGVESRQPDTIVLLDAVDNRNSYQFIHYYTGIRAELWIETDRNGQKITGNYEHGKKQGEWYFWGELCPVLKYDQGEVVAVYCPDHAMIMAYIHLLLDRVFVQFHTELFTPDWFTLYTKEGIIPYSHQANKKLVLNKDGYFSCKGFEQDTLTLRSGEGNWSIKDNQLIFSYTTRDDIIKFQIEGLGNTFLKLKIIK
jgi:hypothetical protein